MTVRMSTTTDQLTLGYWGVRGLGQSIRLVLNYTKTPFTEKRYRQGDAPDYSRDDWLNEKEKLGFDFPNLPYLIDQGIKITQSKAILYYLGRKLNLLGKNLEEEARVLTLCEQAYDLHIQFAMFCYTPEAASEVERKRFAEIKLSETFQRFDDYLKKYFNKFLVGNQVTIADFQVYNCLDICFTLDDDNTLSKKYSHIQRFLESIRQLPELKEFLVETQNQLPINAKHASFGGKILEKN